MAAAATAIATATVSTAAKMMAANILVEAARVVTAKMVVAGARVVVPITVVLEVVAVGDTAHVAAAIAAVAGSATVTATEVMAVAITRRLSWDPTDRLYNAVGYPPPNLGTDRKAMGREFQSRRLKALF